jgi:hypothetical protein
MLYRWHVPRTFGVEIEMINRSLEQVAGTVASVVGGTPIRQTDPDDMSAVFWVVQDSVGREWKVEDDDSLQVPADQRAELVSPVLVESDLELLMRVVEELRATGATVNRHCGVHVHIGAAACAVEHLNKAIDILIELEPVVIARMLGIHEERKRFAPLMSNDFIERFRNNRPRTHEDLLLMWAGPDYNERRRRDRYDIARYNGFNLHSYAYRGTVEFRYFNGTVDAKRVAEYVKLCLGVAERAEFPVPSQEDP